MKKYTYKENWTWEKNLSYIKNEIQRYNFYFGWPLIHEICYLYLYINCIIKNLDFFQFKIPNLNESIKYNIKLIENQLFVFENENYNLTNLKELEKDALHLQKFINKSKQSNELEKNQIHVKIIYNRINLLFIAYTKSYPYSL